MSTKTQTKTATACQKTPDIENGATLGELPDHTQQTSIKWAQRCGEMQGTIASLQGENDMLRTHAEALAEACRAGLKFLVCAMDNRENQAAFRRQLQTALAQWEAK